MPKKPEKKIVFLRKAAPNSAGPNAMLKSIDGKSVAQPIKIETAGPLSHLVPLVETLKKHKRKRKQATGKHPATEEAAKPAKALSIAQKGK